MYTLNQSTFQNDRGKWGNCENNTPSPKLGEGRGEVIKKAAFTLAEVLITLGIIGVVAAMTMPTLIQKQQEKATVAQLKKFYSVVSSAYLLAKNEHGSFENWGLSRTYYNNASEENQLNSAIALDKFIDILAPYLKTTSKCYFSDNSCSTYSTYNILGQKDTEDTEYAPRIALADGSYISHLFIHAGDCSQNRGSGFLANSCASIKIDLNGSKPPNTYGKDIFQLIITKDGVLPGGTQAETTLSFEQGCIGAEDRTLGLGCAAWVIYNENMDYLHCDDLSWNGKKTCK